MSDNLFYSPTSLTIALAITSYGARGNTRAEIKKVLHVDSISSTDLNNGVRKLTDELNAAISKNSKLLTANRLLFQKGFKILKTYKKGISEFYDAKLTQVDYIRNAEKARGKINRWVEKKTNGDITNLIPPSGMLSADTRLILANAIYFKSFWLSKFMYHKTFSGSFFVSQNEEIKVNTMYQTNDFKYFESQELACQVLEMPYIGRKMSIVIYLPKEINGLAELEEKMTYDNLEKSFSLLDASMGKVEVSLPKFQLTQQFDLSDILSKMVAEEMCIPGKADLSGITAKPLFVSKVAQKAFVKLNEEGTEAGAVEYLAKCVTESQWIFKADHPFWFLIRHSDSGSLLFMGRLMKPVS